MMKNNLIAKPIIKNKFWIVEENGKKIATIQKNPAGVVFVKDQNREMFASIKTLGLKHNISFDKSKKSKKEVASDADLNIHGYPTNAQPHNILHNVKNKTYIYTKNAKSKSYFCSGFYIIQFNNGWVSAFCPKLITLERYKYRGPFKTKIEMQVELKKANNESNT